MADTEILLGEEGSPKVAQLSNLGSVKRLCGLSVVSFEKISEICLELLGELTSR